MACGSLLFGAGFGVASVGVMTHNLPVMYAGNIMCGIGYGCAYTPPIQVEICYVKNRKVK